MANLVNESQINVILEELIDQAEKQLVFFCPYFQLHERLKHCLKLRKEDYKLRIAIVFGKNEYDPSRSLSHEDMDFLKSFPNIVIKYEKRLHAKYYANERVGLITSLNLHTYSQNNNIEVGVYFKTKSVLKSLSESTLGTLTSMVSDTEDIAYEAENFFEKVFTNAEPVYENEPQFESKLLGLQKKYISSKILIDKSAELFKTAIKQAAPPRSNDYFKSRNTTQQASVTYEHNKKGFCIRTGHQIPFNTLKPLSWDAYQSWAQHNNPEYKEKFCHGCGKKVQTSVNRPLCTDCW